MPEFLLDGRSVPFEPGQTVMEAAIAAGIYIPHLCWHPAFEPHGSCKLCTVDIDGRPASACTRPAEAGMQVTSGSEALRRLRLRLTQMLFVEGNHFCPSCEKSGDCELQAMGYYLGMTDNHYPHFYPRRELDASHPDILLDRDRCIFCELCVRASRKEGKSVFALAGRGPQTRLVINSPSGRLGDSELDAGDEAAGICPVGAIVRRNTAYRVPIGQRRYDLAGIDEESLARERPLLGRADGPTED
ncbi:MAG: NADP oxidoreductase [Gammaproteobacteria bacterium]|nr:MAG: NADP oxidoreductase [Gammaproteobacteria bacterium]